ncbi:hypothetical protein [Acuticoccus yangtzensis]|uniref:hypothetical protein n=1 Tax=Acuticoccus yangtzensis TaxID=1443441 RepID=UPI0009496D97|nr:hypothetical protein [Acuticoccus yangtzensis]
MRETGSFQFGLLVPGTPTFLTQWRLAAQTTVWDRHYIVGEGYSVKIASGTRLEVNRRSRSGGFRKEEEVISSAFPLDWMVSLALRKVVPKPLRAAAADGRGSAQSLVNALAVDWLPQASVHKYARVFEKGPVTATVTHLTVPDWNASGILLNLRAMESRQLLPFMADYRLEPENDLSLDDWLADAFVKHDAAAETPKAA